MMPKGYGVETFADENFNIFTLVKVKIPKKSARWAAVESSRKVEETQFWAVRRGELRTGRTIQKDWSRIFPKEGGVDSEYKRVFETNKDFKIQFWCHKYFHSLHWATNWCSIIQIIRKHALNGRLNFQDRLGTHTLNRKTNSCQIKVAWENLLADHFDNFGARTSKSLCYFFVAQRKATFLVSFFCFKVIVAIKVSEWFCDFYQSSFLFHATFTIILRGWAWLLIGSWLWN